MAWSSTSESEDQSPTSPYPSGSPSPPGDGCGGGAGTFAEFLAQRRQYGGSDQACVPSVLLAPAPCGHCRKLEDLRRGRNTDTNSDGNDDHRMTTVLDLDLDGSMADQVAFEGNSCFACVKTVYHKTQWIDGGGDCDRRDTPLHCAARSGNLRMLFHLICLLGDAYGHEWAALVLRKLNGRGETALHEAIRSGSRCMAGMLMWVDPELAQFPAAGLLGSASPLYLAVSLGHKHIAETLHRKSGGNLSYSGPHGQNALHAAVNRQDGMIEMLLDWNKDLSKEKDQNGSTPLHCVVSAQSEDIIRRYRFRFPKVKFSLEKHATWYVLDANPSAAYQHDSNGLLPVHIAALMDRKVDILILLKVCGGCVALRDKQGRSFLHIAVQNKAHNIVSYACEEAIFGPILNARNNDGNTALHLAVEVEDLFICCYLLENPKVLLNLRNNKDQTPLDIARSKEIGNFSYYMNPESVIYRTLSEAGARHGSFWRDHVQEFCIQDQLSNQKDEENQLQEVDEANGMKKEDEEKREVNRKKREDEEKKGSDQLTDSTRTLGIGSVLITRMTFGATFAVPAAVKGGNSSSGGITGLFDTWYFNAFMTANALAFICSSIATLCLMFSGMPMIKLQIRRRYFQAALGFASSSLTSLTVAFLLGLHIVLASVGHSVSDAIFLISPLQLSYQTTDLSREMILTYRPLSVRRGHKFACQLCIQRSFEWLSQFWPYIFIFSWAASRKRAA